jgi:hypothetical protein
MKDELNLFFKGLNVKVEVYTKSNVTYEQAFFILQFKGTCHNCGKLGHKVAQYTLKKEQERKRDAITIITCI